MVRMAFSAADGLDGSHHEAAHDDERGQEQQDDVDADHRGLMATQVGGRRNRG